MSNLNRIIADAVEANESGGVINRHEAINVAMPIVLADEELTRMCVRSHLSKAIASNCKKRAKELAAADSAQANLFGLRDAHVLDEAEGNIKQTTALTRDEFRRIIEIRQEQVDRDMAYLNRLRAAEASTRRIWDRHPDWLWGEVEAAYGRLRPVAA